MVSDNTSMTGLVISYSATPTKVESPQTVVINDKLIPRDKPITIGRDPYSFIPVDTQQRSVSRNHAVVYADGFGQLYVADNGSINGTHLNGEKLPGPKSNGALNWRNVKPGDKVFLGGWQLNIVLAP